jgi:glycosyltransferase involved in cell wall biosynthesis
MENENIFVQIAAYRDPQLIYTLKDILEKANKSENLRIGISWQHNPDDEWDNLKEFEQDERFRIIDINYTESQGVCWARNKVQQLYNGEKYTLQIDSHHRFAKDWDKTLIEMLKALQDQGYKKPLITSYIPSFDPDNDPGGRVQIPWKMNFDRYIPEGAVFFLPAAFDSWDDSTKPLPARFYSAHFAFSIGAFSEEVQHDPNYYFHGEEISIAARAFTHGYDLFHPHKVVCWHEYTRKGRTKQWDDDKVWYEKNAKCHLRNRKLFEMDGEKRDIDFGKYGFGKNRSLLDYEKYSGLCFKNRSITKTVSDKRPPSLDLLQTTDEDFYQSLQRIFKHCIDLQFDQVPEKDYDFWCVAFEDSVGKTIYRKDADKNEINTLFNNKSDSYIKLWREFHTDTQPVKWVVWPHSVSKEWCQKLEGNL